jgi:hypothetical protein
MNTQKTELPEKQTIQSLPIWLRKDDIEKILNCRTSKAYDKIADINDKNQIHVVGRQVQTNHFIEYFKGFYTAEFIVSALSNGQDSKNKSVNSTDSA